jgi:hypothetical protein
MRVHVVVTDDAGIVFEGETTLRAGGPRARRTTTELGRETRRRNGEALDFTVHVRAFMNEHAKRLGGPQKFTLLVARLAGGKVGETASLKEVIKHWNKMKAAMGGRFNSAHPTRAKDKGWVDSKKAGTYELMRSWANALEK